MDWYDRATKFATNVVDEAYGAGSKYVSGAWESAKESVLGGAEKNTTEAQKASIPNAQPSNKKGKGVEPKKPVNWQAAGVIVGGLTLLARFL